MSGAFSRLSPAQRATLRRSWRPRTRSMKKFKQTMRQKELTHVRCRECQTLNKIGTERCWVCEAPL